MSRMLTWTLLLSWMLLGCFGSIFDVPTTLPSAEFCITADTEYEWHYASPLSPLAASMHVGYGVNKQQFYRGIIAPISPLFNQFQISISTALPPQPSDNEDIERTSTRISSALRTVRVYPKQRDGLREYNDALEDLIQSEMGDWEYSRNSTDHDATYFFLPGTSIGASTLYHYQYMFAGTGVLRFFTFILSQHATEERFPSLWPWISAKIHPEEEVTISTHVLISQDVFVLSHTADSSAGFEASSDLFGKVLHDHENIENFAAHQMAYISDIRYGQQLLVHLNISSKAPEAHPYFSEKLLHAVKDLMTETLPREDFEELFPHVTFNLSMPWNPITLITRQGRVLNNEERLSLLRGSEILDIFESWRDSVLVQDPLLAYPLAVQARAIRIAEKEEKELSNRMLTTENHSAIDEILLQTELPHDDKEDTKSDNGRKGESDRKRVEAGKIVKVHVSRCAYGNLPPHSVIEMFWELSFLTTITALSLVTVISYFTLGGVLQQLIAQGQLRVPFFVRIHEAGIRLRFLYIWP